MFIYLKQKAGKYAVYLGNKKKRNQIQCSNLRLKCFEALKTIYYQQKNITNYMKQLRR